MHDQFARTRLLLGDEAMQRLSRARVAVFGLGGVGGHVVEALARSGVGALELVDDDLVCLTNLNRQLLATHKTIGQYKADVARERVLEINPSADVGVHKVFYSPDTAARFDFSRYSYVVDAIDTVTGKLELAEQAYRAGTPIISCMGAGNKLDPAAFAVMDISKTSVCPLARVMRKELKKRGIPGLKVVCSAEPALTPLADMDTAPSHPETHARRQVPGSTAFVPAAAGLILAGEVVRELAGVSVDA